MLTELLDFTGILKMLSAAVMVMTTMAIACVLSFLEVAGEAVVEVVVAVEWDPQGQGMVPHPDAPTTGLLWQVSDGLFPLQIVLMPFY